MRIIALMISVVLVLGACTSSKFQFYGGPEVTRILVYKEERKMFLMHEDQVLKHYDIGLGFAPEGHKERRGDGRTPEGVYWIDRRNPNSQFHLSLGISYPNAQDRAYAARNGLNPGGDIFIHGRPWQNRKGGDDWTAGCIAVTNKEIQEIYSMVREDTPILIFR
ncbi:L,D-transpeptidase family protein [Cognatishimia maritima]|uniref:L,D-transpeptidase catalytic domain n=1 Tax=Cognatishimia maritima TaxID=870908 RepID=A0A1M5PAQ9_9RHOB|nr:L,D-transpeptidase family protein [Cognatishimia maritima]SHG98777.1 L,D-transpeptidase catalytic domain [Cognatishimia maritima]